MRKVVEGLTGLRKAPRGSARMVNVGKAQVNDAPERGEGKDKEKRAAV